MKTLQLFLFLQILCIVLNAQKHDYQWILGFDVSTFNLTEGYGTVNIDFNHSNYPILIKLPKNDAYFLKSNANISDWEGKFQCATNGTRIFGSNFSLMQNGDTLIAWPYYSKFGENNPQTALLLPIPENTGRYILFTKQTEIYQGINAGVGTSKIYAHTIDMNQNNGRGRVIEKRKVIMQDSFEYAALTACRHANGRDWWVIQAEFKSNRIHRL
jgi:hypothetical protein